MSLSTQKVGTALAGIGELPVRRRGLLAGLAAVPVALAMATALPFPLAPASRPKLDPEPLRSFPGLAEGFYRAGRHVYYLDEFSATWAPRTLDSQSLARFEPGEAEIPALLDALRRRHWAWAVEHAALQRLDTGRDFAIVLLAEAVRGDPAANLRLCDLLALVLTRTAPYRLDLLFELVDPAVTRSKLLAARLANWRSAAWLARHAMAADLVWRSPGTDGARFTARIARR